MPDNLSVVDEQCAQPARNQTAARQDGSMHTWDPMMAGVVELPNGRTVRGRSLRAGPPVGDEVPDFGIYLTAKPHAEAWESRWVAWPDFRVPRSATDAVAAIEEAFTRSARMKVEIACGGGRGRTGTAIAILARYSGVPAEEAVEWVRTHYRSGAVETPWQRRFAGQVAITR